ncbi:MAG: M16 family metallopeptidase [Pyrinomonadaceae bacterium]
MKDLFCRWPIAVILIFVFGSLTFSQAQSGPAAGQISEFDVNGLKVLIKRRPGTPTVSAGLFFRGGVRNVTAENAGIESFVLRVAGEGSKNFPRQRLRTETSRIGTVISSGASYDYSVLALSSTKLNFDASWEMFTDVAMNPAFVPEDIERIREATLTGLRAVNDSPEGALEQLSSKVIYAGHPYANDPAGTIATVSKFKVADLSAYHKNMLETSRMLLVVVGDVEPSVMQTKLAATFGKLPRGDLKLPPVPPLDLSKPSLDIGQRAVQTDYVRGTFAAPSIGDPDYYAMRTAIAILQSNVFQEVRVKRNLSYAPDADMSSLAANKAEISVSSVDPNQSVRVMLDEIAKLRQGTTDEDELGRMAGFFLTTYYLKQETNAAQVAELAQYELIGGGWRNSLLFLDRIRKVTPADVKAVANKYMKNLRFAVVGNAKDLDRSIFLQN